MEKQQAGHFLFWNWWRFVSLNTLAFTIANCSKYDPMKMAHRGGRGGRGGARCSLRQQGNAYHLLVTEG
jgi:hypothetical protein